MQRFLVCSKIIDFDIHRFTLISNDGERERERERELNI